MRNQLNFFDIKFGKNIKFFEFRLTKILSLLFGLIAFFLLNAVFSSPAKQPTFLEFKFELAALVQSMALLFFYREFTKLATGISFFLLVASAVATVGQGRRTSLTTACAPPFWFTQNACLEHHVTTRQQAIMEKIKMSFKHNSRLKFSRMFAKLLPNNWRT